MFAADPRRCRGAFGHTFELAGVPIPCLGERLGRRAPCSRRGVRHNRRSCWGYTYPVPVLAGSLVESESYSHAHSGSIFVHWPRAWRVCWRWKGAHDHFLGKFGMRPMSQLFLIYLRITALNLYYGGFGIAVLAALFTLLFSIFYVSSPMDRAFIGHLLLSFVLMGVVGIVSNRLGAALRKRLRQN